jgi:hypothetical protein
MALLALQVLELPELLAPRGSLAQLVPMVLMEIWELRALLALLDQLPLRGQPEILERLAMLAQRDRRAKQDLLVHRAQRGQPVLRE